MLGSDLVNVLPRGKFASEGSKTRNEDASLTKSTSQPVNQLGENEVTGQPPVVENNGSSKPTRRVRRVERLILKEIERAST